MPANAVEVTATYEDIPASVTPVTGVTLNKSTKTDNYEVDENGVRKTE